MKKPRVTGINAGRAGEKKAIAGRKPASPSVEDLRLALAAVSSDARLVGSTGWLYVTSSEGWPVREIRLVEEILSDGSKTYTAVLMF
jgi:hypothetical protein